MKTIFGIMALAMVAVTAPVNAGDQDISKEYVVGSTHDGQLVMEKAWVVEKRMIITSPREIEAYNSINDGVYLDSNSVAKFLAKNRYLLVKVYTTDEDLSVSPNLPPSIKQAHERLMRVIESAGGIEQFRKNMDGASSESLIQIDEANVILI